MTSNPFEFFFTFWLLLAGCHEDCQVLGSMEQITGETYQYRNYELIIEDNYWPITVQSHSIILLPSNYNEHTMRHEKVHLFHGNDKDYNENIGYWEGVADMVGDKVIEAGTLETAIENSPYASSLCDYDGPPELRNSYWYTQDYMLNSILLTIQYYHDNIVSRELNLSDETIEIYYELKESNCD